MNVTSVCQSGVSNKLYSRTSGGFSLIELMIVLAIAAILVVAAGPSYTTFVRLQRLDTIVNDYGLALRQARSEAIKSGSSVRVCPPNADRSDCAANGGTLNDGWLVVRQIGTDVKVLVNNMPETQGLRIIPQTAEITFSRIGGANSASVTQFQVQFCALKSGTVLPNGKKITVNRSGQLRATDDDC